jgi:hypothetical protein
MTSPVFLKTCATLLDAGELSVRQIADQLGHAKVSMTQDNYPGRRLTSSGAGVATPVTIAPMAPPPVDVGRPRRWGRRLSPTPTHAR